MPAARRFELFVTLFKNESLPCPACNSRASDPSAQRARQGALLIARVPLRQRALQLGGLGGPARKPLGHGLAQDLAQVQTTLGAGLQRGA